jgi:hypothetical protein
MRASSFAAAAGALLLLQLDLRAADQSVFRLKQRILAQQLGLKQRCLL